jgi:hypothetical protein
MAVPLGLSSESQMIVGMRKETVCGKRMFEVAETYSAPSVAPIIGTSRSRVNGEKAAHSNPDGCAR